MLWMETPTPNLEVAIHYAQEVKKKCPRIFLSYNLSPSFNWNAGNMKDAEIADFSIELGKVGYSWQVFDSIYCF